MTKNNENPFNSENNPKKMHNYVYDKEYYS